jgi:CBS domain-containing protein
MKLPLIGEVMTISPFTIQMHQTLEDAKNIMYRKDIRHLPVLNGIKVIGCLSDRDLKLSLAVANKDKKAADIKVGDCCAPDPYIVSPKEPLLNVLKEMKKRKLGSTFIGTGDELFGIFTVTDAVIHFALLLEKLQNEDDD